MEQFETKMRIVYREHGGLTSESLWKLIIKNDLSSQAAFKDAGLTDAEQDSKLAVKMYQQLSMDIHEYPYEDKLVIDNATGMF